MRTNKSGPSDFFKAAALAVVTSAALFSLPALAQDPAVGAGSASDSASADAAPVTSSSNLDRQPGWYFGIHGGINTLSDSSNEIRGGSGAPGEAGGLLGPLIDGSPLGDALCAPINENIPVIGPVLCVPAGMGAGDTAGGGFTSSYEDGPVVSATFGYAAANGFRPELDIGYRENEFESITRSGAETSMVEGDIRSIHAMGNLWYDFNRSGRFQPYVGVGFGASQLGFKDFRIADVAVSDEDKTSFAYQAGAGVGFKLTDRTRLSLDYRYFKVDDTDVDGQNGATVVTDYEANSLMLGFNFLFGGTPSKCPNTPEGVAVDAEGCPLDSDGDGVPDYLDKCPGTPAGAKVDANGCELDSDGDGVPDSRDQCPDTPAGTAVDDKGCPLDSDGDGVPDYLDKCPNTPAGTAVDAEGCPATDADGDGIADYLDKCANTPKGVAVGKDGCPLDSDGDGIPDYLDECPNSPAGAKVLPNGCAPVGDCRRPRPGEEVDANGCAVEKRFILRGVKFEFDSDVLTQEARVILDGVALTLNNYADINVELAGHTDYIGSDSYNLGLSERRSNSVKNYLTAKGVTAARMTPVGYGLTQPIASNETEEGREENRRVELKVIEQQ